MVQELPVSQRKILLKVRQEQTYHFHLSNLKSCKVESRKFVMPERQKIHMGFDEVIGFTRTKNMNKDKDDHHMWPV